MIKFLTAACFVANLFLYGCTAGRKPLSCGAKERGGSEMQKIAYISGTISPPTTISDQWHVLRARSEAAIPEEWITNPTSYGLIFYGNCRLDDGRTRLISIEAKTSVGSAGPELMLYVFTESDGASMATLRDVYYFGNRLKNSFSWTGDLNWPHVHYISDCKPVINLASKVAPLKGDQVVIGFGHVGQSDQSKIVFSVAGRHTIWELSIRLTMDNSATVDLIPSEKLGSK